MVNGMITMRTFMFLIIFSILTILVALLDVSIYKSDLFTEVETFFSLDPGTNKWMVYTFLFIGFIYTLYVGIKEKIQRNGKKS